MAVALLSTLWLRERPSALQWAGVGLCFLGAAIYLFPIAMAESQATGVIVAAAGVLANAAASILGQDFGRSAELPPIVVSVASMGVGAVVLLSAGVAFQGLPSISLRSWAIIGWLAVVNTAFAFTLWNRTLRTLSATESTVVNGTMLIWIPILAVCFLGERVSAKEVAGLATVGVGTPIVQVCRPRLA